jgi:integrase
MFYDCPGEAGGRRRIEEGAVMAKLFRLNSGHKPRPGRKPWVLDYDDLNGDRHVFRYATRDEMRIMEDRVRLELREGIHTPSGAITLEQAMEQYADHKEQVARLGDHTKGYAGVERQILKLVPDNLKRTKLSEFRNSAAIEKACRALREQGYAISTVKRVKDTLSRVFSFAMKEGHIARNVIRDYPFTVGTPPKRNNDATEEEGARLLLAARRYKSLHPKGQLLLAVNVYAILCLVILTGMRPEEACALHVKSIKRFDFPPPDRPDVWAEVAIKERNTKEDSLRPGTKDRKDRIAQVGRDVVDSFDMVERYHQAERWATGPGHESYTRERVSWRIKRFLESSDAPLEKRQDGRMFIGKEGTLYNSHSLAKIVRKLALQAGIVERDDEGREIIGEGGKKKPRISLYSFRHKVATDNSILLPPTIAAAETGHSVQSYQKHYVHQRAGDQVLAATAMAVREKRMRAELEKLAADEPAGTGSGQRLLTHRK